jgi:DNA-binding response OmpR family regulator
VNPRQSPVNIQTAANGPMTEDTRPTVVIVDDEPGIRTLYERYLSEEYDVRTAATGEAALEAIDESVRVLVLDRRLPDVHGDEVLARITDQGLDLRVVVVTAVEPDFDIIEMPFDDYVVKPVDGDRLRESVGHVVARAEYSDLLEQFYRTANKMAALQAAKPEEELADSEEYRRLRTRANELRDEVTDTLLDIDDYARAFHEVDQLPALSEQPDEPE